MTTVFPVKLINFSLNLIVDRPNELFLYNNNPNMGPSKINKI